MLPFTIKICGITDPRHAIDAMQLGADAIGLNFYQPSKRSVCGAKGAEIIDAMAVVAKVEKRSRPVVVGVFVNHSIDAIVDLARRVRLDGIQLHGDETPEYFVRLKQEFCGAQPPLFFVRAVRTQPASGVDYDASVEAERVCKELASWSDAGVDLLLLDAAATGEFGGTGKTIDWTRVPDFQAAVKQPIVLAGGLGAANVAQAIDISGVRIVDVASGVENEPGQKDADQVREFVARASAGFAKRLQ